MPNHYDGHKLSPKVRTAMLKTFEQSYEKGEFSSSKFYKKWFTSDGTAYHFLFKKNLRVTNIQFDELIALIRCHTKSKDETEIGELQFVATHKFRSLLDSIISTFGAEKDKRLLKRIVDLYGSIMARIVIIDPNFTSCFVCVSKYINLDLLSICASSGYVHSCGKSVFLRKLEKTEEKDLFEALDNFFKRRPKKKKKIFFAVYAHEDFSSSDRSDQGNLRDGLDDVKIHVEKFFMGKKRLVTVLREMKRRYRDRLEIADPNDFKEQREHTGLDPDRTLWLIRDFSIEGATLRHGSDEYYICYEQLWKNGNPFHIFDENKPAWIAHTTIPHTLLGAMINISRPYWGDPESAIICDPFVGTGTTLLETLKYESVLCNASDLEPVAPLLLRDNLEIFAASCGLLEEIQKNLNVLEKHLKAPVERDLPTKPLLESIVSDYKWAYGFAKIEDNEAIISREDVKELESKTIHQRLLFYLALRTALRNIAAFERESRDRDSAYRKEVLVLLDQIEGLIKARKRRFRTTYPGPRLKNKSICVFQTKYSLGCGLCPQKIKKRFDELDEQTVIRDARKTPKNSCNVIVADPPYGFNTEDGTGELSSLWDDSLKAMLGALIKGEGQLIICLPDRSHTGRNLQYFTQKDFVTSQILAIADSMDLEAIVHADVVPSPANLFRPPYYWESERALRRQILHFRFRPHR